MKYTNCIKTDKNYSQLAQIITQWGWEVLIHTSYYLVFTGWIIHTNSMNTCVRAHCSQI